MDGSEMEMSLLGIASEVRPTKVGVNEQTSKKYRINEETGEKTRLQGGGQRQRSINKAEKRKEKSLAFWERL